MFSETILSLMARKRPSPERCLPASLYRSPHVPLAAIRRFVRRIADRFLPDRIILFGPYAYGTPHEESDVYRLAVMPIPDEVSQLICITEHQGHARAEPWCGGGRSLTSGSQLQ
jgi:hypothetical protein